jgi:hypothetical protein
LPHRIVFSGRDAAIAPFAAGKAKMSGLVFLEQYKNKIAALPASVTGGFHGLSPENRQVFTTLLPFAAALKYRNASVKTGELLEMVKRQSIKKIEEFTTNNTNSTNEHE